MKLFEAHIRYYMVAVARNFEYRASNIEVTHSPYSILDCCTIYGNLDAIDSNLDDVAPSKIESGGRSIRSLYHTGLSVGWYEFMVFV